MHRPFRPVPNFMRKEQTDYSVLGVWRFTGDEDAATNTQTASLNGVEPITITCTEFEIKGDTGRNSLSTVYTVEGNQILIRNSGGTEIA